MVFIPVGIEGVVVREQRLGVMKRPGGHKERRVLGNEHSLVPVVCCENEYRVFRLKDRG